MKEYEVIRNAAAGYDTTYGFTTGATSAGYINPEVWSRQVFEAEKESLVVTPLGVMNSELMNGGGDILHLTVGKTMTAAAVAESDKVAVSAIEYLQYNATPSEYGVSAQVTNKQLIRAFFDVMTDKTKEMGIALADLKDTNCITALLADASTKKIAAGKTQASDIASSDTLKITDIVDARTAMRKLNVIPEFMVVSPAAEGDLLKLSGFIDASQYGSSAPIMNGEIGKIMGMRVLMSNNLTVASNKVKTILLGKESFVVAQKANPFFKEDYDVLGRFFTLVAVEDYGVVVHRPDRVATIQTYAA